MRFALVWWIERIFLSAIQSWNPFLNEHLKGFRTEDKGKAGIRKPEGITFGPVSNSPGPGLNQKGQKNTKGGNFKEFSPMLKYIFLPAICGGRFRYFLAFMAKNGVLKAYGIIRACFTSSFHVIRHLLLG